MGKKDKVKSKGTNKKGSVKKCFISHCTDDKEIIGSFSEILDSIYDEDRICFFNTYCVHSGTKGGEKRAEAIRNGINNSDTMIALITDSYLRSTICISEISVCWFKKMKLIPILFTSRGVKFLNDIFGEDIIYIDVTNENAAELFVETLIDCDYDRFKLEFKAVEEIIKGFFAKAVQAEPKRPYIGSSYAYKRIFKPCLDYDIVSIGEEISDDVKVRNLSEMDNIYIVSTTGSRLIHMLSKSLLPVFLAKGGNVTVLLPNKGSEFCRDVAEIESVRTKGYRDTFNRISKEFNDVLLYLREALTEAEEINSQSCGKIYIGCCYNILRQTITLGTKEDDGRLKAWGWMSITIPPKHTSVKTPLFELEGQVQDKAMTYKDDKSIITLAMEHIRAMIRLAEAKGDFYEIDINRLEVFDKLVNGFYLERDSALEYWRELFKKAEENTRAALSRKGELIEIAAQHPLNADGTPGAEFAKRLDFGIELYRSLKKENERVKIYVPGSLHSYKGKADIKPLCEAGRAYLISKRIPQEDILADDMNKKYKGNLGVYNSADECFVAAAMFFDDKYRRLHCVCSPNQMARKKLFYIAFGVIPFYYTVNCEEMFHNDIEELLVTLPKTVYGDHTWQDMDKEAAYNSRKERMPDFENSPYYKQR